MAANPIILAFGLLAQVTKPVPTLKEVLGPTAPYLKYGWVVGLLSITLAVVCIHYYSKMWRRQPKPRFKMGCLLLGSELLMLICLVAMIAFSISHFVIP